jgi:hypothetical protein
VPRTDQPHGLRTFVMGRMQLLPILRIMHSTGKPAINSRCWSHASQRDGVTMNNGLYRLDWTRLAAFGRHFAQRPDQAAADPANYPRFGLIGFLVVLVAGFGGWMALSEDGEGAAGGEPVQLATAAEPETVLPPATTGAQQGALPETQAVPPEVAAADGLRILSQRWRRGGLGSNALVTFTLRNGNDYAVRDIEISCAFSRGDGSHLTDRTRVIHDTVARKGRKTFAHLHIGFVNVNADRARCVPVTASHI